MGVDAVILVTLTGSELVEVLPEGCSIVKRDTYYNEHGLIPFTHEVRTDQRYYGPSYPRGCWPKLSEILMTLLASPCVDKVWYGGDCNVDGETGVEEMTWERLADLTQFYRTYKYRVGDDDWSGRRRAVIDLDAQGLP